MPKKTIKIGVMGSSRGRISAAELKKSFQTGQAIAQAQAILVFGGCKGLPGEAARGAKQAGGRVLAVSPARNKKEHTGKYKFSLKNIDKIIYTGLGLEMRNVINIKRCDAVIFLKGAVGTLMEFCLAYHNQKIIGILEGLGGTAKHFKALVKTWRQDKIPGTKHIIWRQEPSKLVQKILKQYNSPNKKGREMRPIKNE